MITYWVMPDAFVARHHQSNGFANETSSFISMTIYNLFITNKFVQCVNKVLINGYYNCSFFACFALFFKRRSHQVLQRKTDRSVMSIRCFHYGDVIMGAIASHITSLTIVNSTVYLDTDQRKHQSSASLAFVRRIHRDRWIPRTNGQ